MAGTRPTQYTHCTVTQIVTERYTNHIQELDPRVSKKGLFKEYVYVHGYKIKTTAKANIIKIPDDNNKYNQIEICPWWYLVQFRKTHYPKLIIRKAGNDICSTCYQFNIWHKGGGMFCHGVDREKLDELEVDDSVVHLIELDYEKNDINDDDDEEDDEEDTAGYTNSECASLQIIDEANVGAADDDQDNDGNVIGVDDDDDDCNKIYNNNGETEEKDEAFYQREERALKRATLLAKLRKHIEEARFMRKLAH